MVPDGSGPSVPASPMARIVLTTTTDAAGAEALDRPRDDVVGERRVGPGAYEAEHGPFRSYRRTLTTAPAPGEHDGDRASGDRVEVREEIDFHLAIPVWGVLFVGLVKRALADRPDPGAEARRTPWWSPPDRLDARQATVLGLLCVMTLVSGYLGTVLTQTITYAADEFGADRTAQGAVLAGVRVGVLLALVVVALADRRGRRIVLLVAAAAGCVLTVAGAAAPAMAWLAATQTGARAMATALGLLITIVAVEEMPRSSRAYAVSVMAMTAALGAGIAVWLLPLADLGAAAWRVLYVVPLLGLPVVVWVGRRLPETHRFAAAHERPPERAHRSRVALLAVSAFLTTLFLAPASQFQNEFLRDERGFSGLEISLFTIFTNTPGGLGILVGGHLADVRGRRIVGAVGLAGGVAFTVVMFLTAGPTLWVASLLAALIGAATVPALGVYGPELFPTTARGRTNGVIATVGVVGSGLGLVLAGLLSDQLGSLGPALALLAVGPAVLCVVVLTLYPETAHLELEEINPEDEPAMEADPVLHPDAAGSPDDAGGAGADQADQADRSGRSEPPAAPR